MELHTLRETMRSNSQIAVSFTRQVTDKEVGQSATKPFKPHIEEGVHALSVTYL